VAGGLVARGWIMVGTRNHGIHDLINMLAKKH
jgi:hypothetical protein